MGALADFYNESVKSQYSDYWHAVRGLTLPGAIANAWEGYNRAYDNSHGGDRFVLSQFPGFSQIKNFLDRRRQWDDSYRNSGRDPEYNTTYGSPGIPGLSDIASGFKPVRMARSLARMYGCEVELNIAQVRRQGAYAFRQGAHDLRRYGEMKERNGW